MMVDFSLFRLFFIDEDTLAKLKRTCKICYPQIYLHFFKGFG